MGLGGGAMESNNQDQELSLIIVSPRTVSQAQSIIQVNKIYHLWKKIWKQTFQEVKANINLSADHFLKHDEILVIYNGEQPIGMFCLDWYWTKADYDLELKYWDNYPKLTLKWLETKSISCLMSMSFLTVHPDWRRRQTQHSLSDLLVGFAVQRYLESSADVLLTYTRNDRKTNELGYRHGGEKIPIEHWVHNIPSDVLVFDRNSLKTQLSEGLKLHIDSLWNNKKFLSPSLRPELFNKSLDKKSSLNKGDPYEHTADY